MSGGFLLREVASRNFMKLHCIMAVRTSPNKSFNHSQPHIQFVRFLISTVACWPWNWRWLLPHFPPVPSIPALLLQHDVSIVPDGSPLPTPLVGMTASVAPSCGHLSQLDALPAIKVSFWAIVTLHLQKQSTGVVHKEGTKSWEESSSC